MEYTVDNGHTDLAGCVAIRSTNAAIRRLMRRSAHAREEPL